MALFRGSDARPSMRVRSIKALSQGPEQRWRDKVGSAFLYTAASWGAVSWYLEAYMRDISGKALARLYDVTADAGVVNSTLTVDGTDGGGYTRVRSVALTLVDGHEYRVQFGVQDGGMTGALGAKMIAK